MRRDGLEASLRFSDASLRSRAGIPSRTLTSSRDLGWTSILVDYHRDEASHDPFETGPTPDQTITVMVEGVQRVESLSGGIWRRSTYRTGTIGLTPPGQTDRLRRRQCAGAREAGKVTLYVPHPIFLEAAEHYGRPGRRGLVKDLNALAFEDLLLAQMALGLLRAARAGAPELYAQSAAHWIAAHLLARRGPLQDLAEDGRRAGAISDRRLQSAIEYMDEHLSEPLSLQQLADVAGISKFHFARIFRDAVGLTPHAFLVQRRLRTARHLLVTTDEHVAQVAVRCGFRTGAHFGSRFAREYGMTPTAYRRGGL